MTKGVILQMLNDIPYSILEQDERAYEIMLLRDQHDNTFIDIAKEHEVSVVRVKQIYDKIKIKQIRLYINHIAFVLGHQNTSHIREVFDSAYECYQELAYACAYLEKKYKKILDEYRDGEPGMPTQFVKSMPPFMSKLSKEKVARIVEMREIEKLSYVAIGRELNMTQAKARHTYEWFYHEQVLELIKALQETVKSREEKEAIWNYHFRGYKTSKKRYEALMERGGG